MTTPRSFRKWALMYGYYSIRYDRLVEIGEDGRAQDILRHRERLLRCIERKEKALRETVSIGQDITWKAITQNIDHAECFRLERSRIAERVRGLVKDATWMSVEGGGFWRDMSTLADDIKEGKV